LVNTDMDIRDRRAEQPECPANRSVVKGEKTSLFGGACFVLTSALYVAHG
jgi:hypothetical protein